MCSNINKDWYNVNLLLFVLFSKTNNSLKLKWLIPWECTSQLQRGGEFPDVLVYMNSLRKQIIELFVIKVKFQPILLA